MFRQQTRGNGLVINWSVLDGEPRKRETFVFAVEENRLGRPAAKINGKNLVPPLAVVQEIHHGLTLSSLATKRKEFNRCINPIFCLSKSLLLHENVSSTLPSAYEA